MPPDICPCTHDDFGCTFGNYLINGLCIQDPDYDQDKIVDSCVPGELVLKPSRTKKVEGDICKSNIKWSGQQSDICKFTEQDYSIYVLIGSTIKFTLFNDNWKQGLINLPIDLSHVGNIKRYVVNLNLRCLYVLNETGIIKFSYNNRELAFINSEEIFLPDHSLLGMRLDQSSNAIFYYNRTNIFIINEISKYRKVIYSSQYDITYVNIFPSIGIILYAYTRPEEVLAKHCVNFLSMIGEIKSNLCYEWPIRTIAHDYENKQYFFYFDGFVIKIDYNLMFLEKKATHIQDILEAYVNEKEEYFITKNGIFFGQKVFKNKHITYGQFHLVQKTEIKDPCLLAHCDIFCFALSSITYECGCPTDMIFNKTLLKCVCDASHPNCIACKSNEFHCNDQKCVPISSRCNGVNNCEDLSDEKNCVMTCEVDELLCDQDSKCVSFLDICDGFKNCEDGKDELHCHTFSKCNKDQYRCLNGDCIPKNKYCDDIKDCSDYSDEVSCQPGCKYFEASCNNGQCVMKNQICDNNFDCADLSDEHGCDLIVDVTKNISCLIKCDNKCIPHDKLCNHITDCGDGRDEIGCKHMSFCFSETMLKCFSDSICYELHRKCDGFNDCLDRTDETYCEKHDICSKTDIFHCDSMRECISINDYCDGKKDCADNSDEGLLCITNNFIKSINIKNMTNGHLTLTWISNENIEQSYNVSFIASKNNISFIGKIMNDNYLQISGLTNCNKYTAIVKIPGLNIGRILQFTYKSSLTKSPKILQYDYSQSLLYWSYNLKYCISNIFYIECLNRDRIVLQNFSTHNYILIPNNLKLACHVSACPFNVFNLSCSSFSSTIYIEYYSLSIEQQLLFLVLILLLIMVCTLYFVQRKRKLLLMSICNCIFSWCMKLSKRNISVSAMKYEQGDVKMI